MIDSYITSESVAAFCRISDQHLDSLLVLDLVMSDLNAYRQTARGCCYRGCYH
jgi:hypothetical protein